MEEEIAPSSDFYRACGENDITFVRELLRSLPLEELDYMEPNNSTALHVACYRNHRAIVALLLGRGFTRCVRNRYGKLPIQEVKREALRQLFLRSEGSDRFGGRTSLEHERLTWSTLDSNRQQPVLNPITDIHYRGDHLEHGVFRSDDICQRLSEMPKMNVIRRYLRRAVEENDWKYFIQAYTADTDFAQHVNDYLRTRNEENGFLHFVQTICLNDQLHSSYSYVGVCYRCICVESLNQLGPFKDRGSRLTNRTFVSATKSRHIAEEPVRLQRRPGEYLVTLIFKIRERRSALEIDELSEFRHEEEVLIICDRVFEVRDVTQTDPFTLEIKLSEWR